MENDENAQKKKNEILIQAIIEKKTEIDILRTQLNSINQEVNELKNHLNTIVQSRGYRVLQKFYSIRTYLLPRGSKRFYFIKFLINMPRYLLKGYIRKSIKELNLNGFRGFKGSIKQTLSGKGFATEKKIVSDKYASNSKEMVEIIICVNDTCEYIGRCVESIFEFTSEPYKIIIIDDGCNDQTRNYLADLEKYCPNIILKRNEKSDGYAKAINIGLKLSNAEYCVLLSSNTIVSKGWIDKLVCCIKSDSDVGIASPLSNAALWQSVPYLQEENGDLTINNLPKDIDIEKYVEIISETSECLYPKIPLLNGFCLIIHRSVIERIGYFDERKFNNGFCEDYDYCMRAGLANIKLALVDNTYVYYECSDIYANKRKLQIESNFIKLRRKYRDAVINNTVDEIKNNKSLDDIRSRVRSAIECEFLITDARKRWEGHRILIHLPNIESFEQKNEAILLMQSIIKMGFDVNIFNVYNYISLNNELHQIQDIPIVYGYNCVSISEYADNFDFICTSIKKVSKTKKIINSDLLVVLFNNMSTNSFEYLPEKCAFEFIETCFEIGGCRVD